MWANLVQYSEFPGSVQEHSSDPGKESEKPMLKILLI